MQRQGPDMIRVSRRRDEQGVSLIIVLLLLMVVSVLAAAIVFTARTETLASYNWKLNSQADYLAKAGIQYAANWLRSSEYQAVSPTSASTYYSVTASGGTYNTYTSNVSPVQCAGTTGCAAGKPVQLISIPYSSGSTTFPIPAVKTNFRNDFPSTGLRISGSPIDSGVVYVNMVLLNYQTVEQGNPPQLSPSPVETWLIISRAYWTGLSSAAGTYPIAVAEEQAVVQPLYLPIWANAIYGYCSASMSGSSGTCTDAFNSALGAYASGNNATAASGCDSATANNVIDAGAGVGANGYVSLTSNVSVAGNVTIGSNPTGGAACCSGSNCGFQGSTSGVKGQVVSGPYVPPPSAPTFPSNLSSAPSPGGGATTYPQQCNPPALTAGTGGGLADGWYYYTVTALGSPWGESTEAERAIQLTGVSNAVTLSWPAIAGATAYRVYRGTTSGGENVYYETANTSFTDLGAAGTAGAPPGGVVNWPQAQPPPMSVTPQGGGSLADNQTFCYVVTAIGATWGESGGGETCGTTGSGKKTLAVSWPAFPSGTPSNYRIYRGTAAGAENLLLATLSVSATSFTDSGTLTGIADTPPANKWNTFMSSTGANPPFLGCSAPCVAGSSCDGTVNGPLEINTVSMHNGDTLQLIGGKDIFHPVYYDIYGFQETGGSILVSGYVVINIQNSLKIAGNGMANALDYQSFFGVMVNVPPECVQIYYAGTSAQIQGNGAVCAVITAPNAAVSLGGGGSAGYMIGAIRALNVSIHGGYPLHYDIQLAKAGGSVSVMTTTAYSRKRM
jgi:hypothetical protein